jgi:hypothetical protein
MYAIRIPGEVSLRKNEALAAYARMEYRSEDVYWLLAAARAKRASKAPTRSWRLFGRRASPTHAPVAHKGSPRLSAEEAPFPA